MDLLRLQRAISDSWCEDTRQPPYSGSHPSAGQCCVSALVVQHYLGGTIVRGITNRGGVHYWNQLEGGAWYDPTRAQFAIDEHVVDADPAPAAHLYLFQETLDKFELLLGLVRERLAADSEADQDAASPTTGDSLAFVLTGPRARPHRDTAAGQAIQASPVAASLSSCSPPIPTRDSSPSPDAEAPATSVPPPPGSDGRSPR